MKAVINILGFMILSTLALGMLFKIQHWPGASVMLMYGMGTFALFFVPVFFGRRIKNSTSGIEKASNIVGMIALFLITIGLIFKNNHWPGASLALAKGSLLFLIATVLYVVFHFKQEDKSKLEIGKAVIIGVFASVFLILYAVKPQSDILASFELLNNEQVNSTRVFDQLVKKQTATLQNEAAKSIAQNCDSAIKKINHTKKLIIEFADGQGDYATTENKIKDISLVENSFNLDAASYIMVGDGGPSLGKALKNEVSLLREQMISAIQLYPSPAQTSTIKQINEVLNTNDNVRYGEMQRWEVALFEMSPVVGALASLTGIENNIRIAQFYTNNYLLTANVK